MLLVACYAIATIASLALGQHLDNENVPVFTEAGVVSGRRWKFGDAFMNEFLGIPYAVPPVGKLRFKRPVKLESLVADPYQAHEYGRPCVQFMEYHALDKYSGANMRKQSENCLYLNVFAPFHEEDDTRSHPVIVWIHGGSFLAGSGDTGIDPEVVAANLISRGIVLVTLNYRLGPFGFLSTSTSQEGIYEGNYGLYDILLALQYINRNIRNFGGNPRAVTIMGESAGGAAVSLLAASPLAKDMVHGAIVLSGSSLASWAVHSIGEPFYHVNNMLRYLNCEKHFDQNDVKEIRRSIPNEIPNACNLQRQVVKCAKKFDSSSSYNMDDKLECLRGQLDFSSLLFKNGLTSTLGVSRPVVDGQLIPSFGGLQQRAHVPLMTGVARLEWAHKKPMYYGFKKSTDLQPAEMHGKIDEILRQSLESPTRVLLPNSTLHLIGNATYFRYITATDTSATWPVENFVRALQQIESDMEFVTPCWTEADAYARAGRPVYLYSWDYLPKSAIIEYDRRQMNFFGRYLNVTTRRSTQFKDAFHGLDHAFLFTRGYSGNFELVDYDQDDADMAALFCTVITNFAKHSNPTKEPIRGFSWPPYSVTHRRYVSLTLPPAQVNSDLFYPTPQFWAQYIGFLTGYVKPDPVEERADISREQLTETERKQLAAYRRAWLALWVLVGGIAFGLWILIACLVFKRCTKTPNKNLDNLVLTSNR